MSSACQPGRLVLRCLPGVKKLFFLLIHRQFCCDVVHSEKFERFSLEFCEDLLNLSILFLMLFLLKHAQKYHRPE